MLAGVATASMIVAGLMIFLYAPADALEGDVQRIFYLHVSTAIGAYAAFTTVAVGGILYLRRESRVADRVAIAAAEVGLLFTTVTLVMGSLYGKAIWGTYWTWDARLTSTLVLWMMYAAYVLVRRIASPGRQAARFAAVVGIIGALDIPIVHFSVNWWRTQHPQSVLTAPGGPALPPEMLITFFVTLAATLLMGFVLVVVRYRIEAMSESVAISLEERQAA
jgi:heme exporter protein C